MKEVFRAKVILVEGRKRLDILHKPYYLTKINKLKEGKDVWITVDERKPKRSEQQNRLYWLYISNICKEHGGSNEELHLDLVLDHGVCDHRAIEKDGKKVEVIIPKSTTQYTKAEFTTYLLKIEHATGVPIPDTEKFFFGEREAFQIEYPNNNLEETKF